MGGIKEKAVPDSGWRMPGTVGEALKALRARLAAAGVEDPGTQAEWLMVETLGCGRSELSMHRSRAVPDADRVLGWMDRLVRGEPLQYVLGYTDFMGYRIRCDARALIPRPETEELVERVWADPMLRGPKQVAIADVGAGTGCIAIAMAGGLPHATVLAVDRSRAALDLARENIDAHGLGDRIRLLASDLLAAVPETVRFDAIVSNPPYVAEDAYSALPRHIREYEPSEALRAGQDGLATIRRLAPEAASRLVPGGGLFLEIGDEQGPAVTAILRHAGFPDVTVHLDLAGRNRIVQARISHV